MEDGVDVVFTQEMLDGGWGGDVAVFEGEVGIGLEASGVVEGCAVREVVHRDDVVRRVGEDEMSDEPASSLPSR
jgi:hypothetical protein